MPEIAGNSNRIEWVEPCKGIGITAIVLGHSLPGTATASFLFLFHVPLFFFLSGYLHKPQPAVYKYLKKKLLHLMLPYCAFLVALSPPDLLHFARHGGSVLAWGSTLAWGGDEMHGPYAVFWFVSCLFLTQQVMNLLLVKLRLRAVAVIVLGFLVICYTLPFRLPLDANVVMAAAPFFLAGYCCRKFELPQWAGGAGAVLMIVSIPLILGGVPISYDMKYAKYGVPVLSFILALGCIVAIVAASRTVTRLSAVGRPFALLGSASMGIMYLHEFVLGLVERFHAIHGVVAFLIALGLSFAMTRALASQQITRMIFLGEMPRPRLMPATV